MSATVNCLLSPCSIIATNVATSSAIVTTNPGSPQAGAMVVGYDAYSVIPNGAPYAVTLPTTTIYAVYLRNLGATNNLEVFLTPSGGSAWTSPAILIPGGVFIYWTPYTTAPGSGGFTALSLQAVGGSTPAEIFLAG
jgi:hypothetical protein